MFVIARVKTYMDEKVMSGIDCGKKRRSALSGDSARFQGVIKNPNLLIFLFGFWLLLFLRKHFSDRQKKER